ncbi:ribonuclease H-like protein [Myriangium duriaei CBS 260.36]|uniref:Ribonuclease H-like protein n=1 Tax=Myriangium duriaei CBS 260.36 TaxID=1168546 RepID=A0A9P4JCH8_9PEZI|nr:ribonuclease H-like protein [Myriangium duriaei CBS 260.36]
MASKVLSCDELDYRIPPSVLQATRSALEAGNDGFWSYTLFKSSTGIPVRVHYCTNKDAAESVARMFENQTIVGFDMEWEAGAQPNRNTIKDNVSVIQIASESRVAVFHLALFKGEAANDLMPSTLMRILESESIVKAGVNIAGDFTRLRKCLNIDGRGLFELSHLYKVVRYSGNQPELINKIPASMDEQVQHVFGLPLMKGAIRVSAWSGRLSNDQISYAVTDAYAGFRLYDQLERMRKAMNPIPPLPAFYELAQPIILGNGLPPPKRRAREKFSGVSEDTTATTSVGDGMAKTAESLPASSHTETIIASNTDDVASEYASTMDQEAAEDPEVDRSEHGTPISSDPRLVAVEAWASSYRSERLQRSPSTRWTARPAAIRAYALWHQHDLAPEEVAQLLRDPPLKVATINSYIIEAVALDRQLPFDLGRLRAVFESLPGVVAVRFKSLARTIGIV